MMNLLKPRYILPVHGDFKRLRLHSQLAEQVGHRAGLDLPRQRTACRSRSTSAARAGASAEQAGMIFVDGVDIGDPEDVALRDRRMLSADGIFIVVATISEQDGRSVADPEIIFRGVPFLDEPDEICSTRSATRSRTRWKSAAEDIGEICAAPVAPPRRRGCIRLQALKRRPMILPVSRRQVLTDCPTPTSAGAIASAGRGVAHLHVLQVEQLQRDPDDQDAAGAREGVEGFALQHVLE